MPFPVYIFPQREKLFPFEWGNSNTGWKVQLTWTALPQGFKKSHPTFGNQLAKELESWKKQILDRNLLQYRLYSASNQDWKGVSWCYSKSLLNFLVQTGCRVSKKKAQLAKKSTNTSWFWELAGIKRFGEKLKRSHLPDSGAQDLKRFVRLLRYGWVRWVIDCQLWGTGKTPEWSSTEKYFIWIPESQRVFRALKRALVTAPAWRLWDLSKPFELFCIKGCT